MPSGARFLTFEGARYEERPQLMMRWPPARLEDARVARIADGYTLRAFQAGDEEAFLALVQEGDFDPWDEAKLAYNASRVLPGGWLFAEESRTGRCVGTALALHNYGDAVPFRGDVGWLMVSRPHRGRGLGRSLAAAVTARFLAAGYEDIVLHTEYFRRAAILTYLRVGYVPVLLDAHARSMWSEACADLAWPFTPAAWPVA